MAIYVVDSSIWVKAFYVAERDHDLAHEFYRGVSSGKNHAVVPCTAMPEISCSISRRLAQTGWDQSFSIAWCDTLLSCPFITWKLMDRRFYRDAAFLGFAHGLRGMDAIMAALAVFYDVPLVTDDKEFQRAADVLTVLSLQDVQS